MTQMALNPIQFPSALKGQQELIYTPDTLWNACRDGMLQESVWVTSSVGNGAVINSRLR